MSEEQGWVKIHRSLRKQEWFEDSIMVHIFIELLFGANFEDSKYKLGNNQVTIKRGQYPHGLRYIGRLTKLHPSTISRKIEYMIADGLLVKETLHQRTILTICNYDSYQGIEDKNVTQTKHKRNSNRTAIEQQVIHNKELEEGKEGEELQQQEQIPEVVSCEKSLLERDKELLIRNNNLDSPESVISYWYDILNTFGIDKPVSLDDKASSRDWASSKDMLDNCNTDKEGLKLVLYEYAYNKFLNHVHKNAYVKKAFSSYMTELNSVCKHLKAQKIVKCSGNVSKGGMSVEDIIKKYNK